MLQWLQNNLGIIIIAISFGISGLGWLFQKLKQAQEKKRAEQARQRARLEALRTGRIESPPPAVAASGRGAPARGAQAETPRQRLEDLARRRQQEQQQRTAAQRRELEEQLRRRREAIDAQRQRQQQQRQPAPPRRPAAPQPGPRQGVRQPQGQPQAPARAPAQRREVRPVEAPRRAGERRQVSALPSLVPVQESVITDMIEAPREGQAAPVMAPLPRLGGRPAKSVVGRDIDLRQAMIMREIFDRPVGLRNPMDPGW